MVPERWAGRVMEALLRVRAARGGHIHSVTNDEIVTAVLLELRVGTFKEGNLNIFKRYSFDTFRCHVCNHVLPVGAHAPDTVEHLSHHRRQVRQALNPDCHYTDDWRYSDEPTEEEVRQEDERITRLEQEARKGFHQEVRR